jgi:hypothetical protein
MTLKNVNFEEEKHIVLITRYYNIISIKKERKIETKDNNRIAKIIF